ncbi:3-oxoacyl-[acyl-carrier protein] reductase [Butyrivibrio proteoclasticus]|uniref:3-oxoacyl-[acyl-carrier protein] reductase n=1 Tax=Butyrivibrio proteoclasticus TaxID=43305 RepID=A0A1I5PWF8_9FIRM|nr:SDR family oxidoreductase [Butyrivibrio proteoclasticus]SFP38365.1 3-oxoacyl-[acyl-carrier protein] reductase [Butyrivibrio proteoclasticus]
MGIKSKVQNTLRLLRTKEIISVPSPVKEEELLKGKTALISGGSGGIGYAIAEELLRLGCFVVIAGTSEDKLARICNGKGLNNLRYIVLNMKEIQLFSEKVREVCEMSPNDGIDILVNCAGINNSKTFLEVDECTFDDILDINLKGTYFLSQSVAKIMISKKIKGHILNLSSASALRPASQPYAISKWAITGMTKGLADELIKYGIIVNALAPGPTATPMLGKDSDGDISHSSSPIGRYALPQEVARLAGFMVSGYGDLIVGDTYYISGGSGTISLHK